MKGPLATCRHTVGFMHTVSYDFPGMCGHWAAQVAALKWLAEYTMRRAEELEADL